MENIVITKEQIESPKSLRMGGNLQCTSFNGKQTLEEAKNHAVALLKAVEEAEREGVEEIHTVFGINRRDVNGKMCMMVGFRK